MLAAIFPAVSPPQKKLEKNQESELTTYPHGDTLGADSEAGPAASP